jgi:hypothetical protein
MYKLDLLKFDPLAYVLITIVLALEIYTSFLRGADPDVIIRRSEAAYQAAVFENPEDKGILRQIFRQNEIDRELLKATLAACSR